MRYMIKNSRTLTASELYLISFVYEDYSDILDSVYFDFRGGLGSTDSPFDFNKKMKFQYDLMKKTTGKAQKPNNWWDYCTQAPQGVTVADKTLANGVAIDPFTPGSAMPAATSLLNVPTAAFLPGLGLMIFRDDYSDPLLNGKDPSSIYGSWIIEAGTDCVGFAQRAMGWNYDSTPSGTDAKKNGYLWRNLNPGWTEYQKGAGTDNIWELLNAFKDSSRRQYPKVASAGITPLSDEIIIHEAEISFADLEQSRLQKIIPGDILYTYEGSHIAIVQDVSRDASGAVTGVRLLEATQWAGLGIQNVTNIMDLNKLVGTKTWYQSDQYRIVRLKTSVGGL